MKNLLKNTGTLLLFITLIFSFISCKKENSPNNNSNNGDATIANLQSQITALPAEPLSQEELSSLSLMREEEKLARDVYTYLYSKWGSQIFANISNSEQAHMNAILMLLNKYHLPDPVGANEAGVFSNPKLQTLYLQLTAQGNTNLLNAFKVGATIEDLDIFDLKKALNAIDNQDIQLVYNNLAKGSRNHMRAFYKNIVSNSGIYTAQFISQHELDAIINSAMEKGF